MRLWITVALEVILLSVGGAVSAQAQPAFEVLTYDNRSGVVARFDQNSTRLASFQLPLPEGYVGYSSGVYTDRTLSYIAYHVSSADRDRYRFMVYRLGDQPQVVISYPLDFPITDSLGSAPNAQVFSDDRQQVFYTYISLESNSLAPDKWTALVFDLASGEVLHRLAAEDFLLEHDDLVEMPTPLLLRRNKAIFLMHPFSSMRTEHFNVFLWDLQDNTVRAARYRMRRDQDYNGELTLDTAHDSHLPDSSVSFADERYQQVNGIAVNFDNEQRGFLYSDSDVAFRAAHFVQGGQRVLARSESPIMGSVWLLIAPDGSLISSTPSEQAALPLDVYTLRSVPDGFVYESMHSLFFVDTTTGTLTKTLLSPDAGKIIGVTVDESQETASSLAYMSLYPQFDQDVRWTTALYDSSLRRLWVVNSSGQVLTERTLPITTDAALGYRTSSHSAVQTFPFDVASNGDNLLAYTSFSFSYGDKYLQVYDITQDRLVLNRLLPENSGENNLNVSPAVFSPSGNTLYFGYSPSGGWLLEQISIDPNSEQSGVRATLRGDDPRFAEMPIIDMEGNQYPYFPITLFADDERVVFTFGTAATNIDFQARILEWHPSEDVLTYANDEWINPHQVEGCWQSLCAGHVLMAGYNDHFASLNRFSTNMFQVLRQEDYGLFSFYTSAIVSPERAIFVENGTMILAGVRDPEGNFHWSVLRRTGFPETDLWVPSETVYSVIGTQNGWLYTGESSAIYETSISDQSRPAEPIIRLPARALHFLWIHEPESTDFPMTDVWEDIVPLFQTRDRVTITTEANQLRMRVTPGGEVQRQFNAGAVVTIVDGPMEVAGTIWWQVRDENGLVGWVAEGSGGVPYLTLAQ